ncbi:MAG: hypothetical protein HKN46_01935 [Acidimicrobiia bacterium]|nr:hypothetical protein [Acidimicrobiia bacterium]
MRSFISTLAGLTLLTAIFFVGGAGFQADDTVPDSTPATPLPIAAPFTEDLEPFMVRDVLRPTVSTASPVPVKEFVEPAYGQTLNQWFGCDIPKRDAVCILRDIGVGALVPEGPDDPADRESIERWRPLVSQFFEEDDVDRALDVMWCESRGDRWAKNPNSTASGLFQHLASMWGDRAPQAGFAGADVFDPVANVGVAAWLVYERGGWSHWYPSESCWR